MAPKGGMGPMRGKVFNQPAPYRTNPIIAHHDFVHNTKQFGGASMDINTGKVYGYGEGTGIAIGGEPDAKGRPIRTTYYGRRAADPTTAFNSRDVDVERAKLKSKVGRRENMLLGAWNPGEEDIVKSAAEGKNIRGINIDASRIYTPQEAATVFKERPQEKAGVDMSNFENVDNPYFKPGKKG